MTDQDPCAAMRLLVQADVDGELVPAEAAATAAHLEQCADCRTVQTELLALKRRVAAEVPRYEAPGALRTRIVAAIGGEAPSSNLLPRGEEASHLLLPLREETGRRGRLSRSWLLTSFASGAIAASLAFFLILPRGGNLGDQVVADHIRALQPGHLMDVVSTDQHNVKPWFDGRIDFAPPVKNLAAEGFPLQGGRLDYLDGHETAALVYRIRQHLINLYIWPSATTEDASPRLEVRNGYNLYHWIEGRMTFWAVSDLNAAELGDFVAKWRRAS